LEARARTSALTAAASALPSMMLQGPAFAPDARGVFGAVAADFTGGDTIVRKDSR